MAEFTAGTWKIDTTHSEVGFTVRHLMSKVRGKFETFEGEIVTDSTGLASSATATVELSSVNTGTEDRDNHLRSSDFFSVDETPTMTFQSTGIRDKGETYVALGDLTIRGVTKPVELDVEVLGEGGDPWGGTRLGLEATTTISRKEFGIDFNIPVSGDKLMIGDKVTIQLTVEAVLQA
ncbi:YceI family protein [Solicola gregarius]|uniref:YceI family protein n=1 Tax=Solicola gregarius TaxID=2908642 RepID=A0AA46TFF8_9ACTN|nr:YceI family protein [Solicola gregarius]UYM04255.1 YceI family protein [Solicola gregarius]